MHQLRSSSSHVPSPTDGKSDLHFWKSKCFVHSLSRYRASIEDCGNFEYYFHVSTLSMGNSQYGCKGIKNWLEGAETTAELWNDYCRHIQGYSEYDGRPTVVPFLAVGWLGAVWWQPRQRHQWQDGCGHEPVRRRRTIKSSNCRLETHSREYINRLYDEEINTSFQKLVSLR